MEHPETMLRQALGLSDLQDQHVEPWQWLGLPSATSDANQIRAAARRQLQKLAPLRERSPVAEWNRVAQQIRQAARQLLATSSGVDRPATSPDAQPANRSRASIPAKRPTAKVVAQPVARPATAAAQPSIEALPAVPAVHVGRRRKRGAAAGRRADAAGWLVCGGLLLALFVGIGLAWMWWGPPVDLAQLGWSKVEPPTSPRPAPSAIVIDDQQDANPNPLPSRQPADRRDAASQENGSPQPNSGPEDATDQNASHVAAEREPDEMAPPEKAKTTADPHLQEAFVAVAERENSAVTEVQLVVALRRLEIVWMGLSQARLGAEFEATENAWQPAPELAEDFPQLESAFQMIAFLKKSQSDLSRTIAQRLPLVEAVGELPIDDTFVSVIRADSESIVLRAAGQRLEYRLAEIPWSVTVGILGATHGRDPYRDQARQLVVQMLRQGPHGWTPHRRQETLGKFAALPDPRDDATDYPREEMQRLAEFLQLGGRLERMVFSGEAAPRRLSLDFDSLLATMERNDWDGSNPASTDSSASTAATLEEASQLWLASNPEDASAVAQRMLLVYQRAASHGDLAALLQELRALDFWLELPAADHSLWTDTATRLLRTQPNDPRLLAWLEQTWQQIEHGQWSAATSAGLRTIGRNLATELSNLSERRTWVRRF